MKAKLILILCIFVARQSWAQPDQNLNTNGLFSFVDTLPIDSSYLIAPGQVSKKGGTFFLGLTSENEVFDEGSISALYRLDLSGPDAMAKGPQRIDLSNPENQFQFYQCSLSADENVVLFVVNNGGGWLQNQLGIATKDAAGNFSSFRVLDELNDSTKSDSYPWLSGDGLRIYFTREFKIMFAERRSLQDKFSSAAPIDFEGTVQLEIVSAWFTADELDMYMIAGNRIYKSTRKSKQDSFGFPSLFTDEFKDFYFIAGLSFAPDKKTMYLYYYDEYADYILQYQLKKGKI